MAKATRVGARLGRAPARPDVAGAGFLEAGEISPLARGGRELVSPTSCGA
jgi:hypothetical protein